MSFQHPVCRNVQKKTITNLLPDELDEGLKAASMEEVDLSGLHDSRSLELEDGVIGRSSQLGTGGAFSDEFSIAAVDVSGDIGWLAAVEAEAREWEGWELEQR
jgi:hypothetical protein